MITKKRNDMEITTDTYGIPMRNYQDTLVTRDIPVQYGYYNNAGEYIENGTLEITSYRYNHRPMHLYELNQNQPAVRLEDYEAPYFEAACYKGCLLYTSPSPRDKRQSRMPSSA